MDWDLFFLFNIGDDTIYPQQNRHFAARSHKTFENSKELKLCIKKAA